MAGSTGDPARELLVLGVVRRQPLSKYSIDRTVRRHTPLYRGLKKGNTYHLVERLAAAGYLHKSISRAKRGPAETKVTFQLSAAGEERFQKLLAWVIHDAQSGDPALEIGFVLLGQIPRAQALRLLVGRKAELARQEQRIQQFFGDADSRSGPAYIAGSHAVHRLQSEQRFLREMLKQVENPRWHPEWLMNDGAVLDPRRRL
jgi:DNA-binding PadR family transcriptional regulator